MRDFSYPLVSFFKYVIREEKESGKAAHREILLKHTPKITALPLYRNRPNIQQYIAEFVHLLGIL